MDPILQPVEGAQVLLSKQGVYQMASVFHRGRDLFARSGNGYVRLHGGGVTSSGRTRWSNLIHPEQASVFKDPERFPELEIGVYEAWISRQQTDRRQAA